MFDIYYNFEFYSKNYHNKIQWNRNNPFFLIVVVVKMIHGIHIKKTSKFKILRNGNEIFHQWKMKEDDWITTVKMFVISFVCCYQLNQSVKYLYVYECVWVCVCVHIVLSRPNLYLHFVHQNKFRSTFDLHQNRKEYAQE